MTKKSAKTNPDWAFPISEEIRSSLKDISVDQLTALLSNKPVEKGGKFSDWTNQQLSYLHEFRIDPAIKKLTGYGINKETVALSLLLIRMAPDIDHLLKNLFGDKRTRLRNAKSLQTAAAVLDGMSTIIPEMPGISKIPDLATTKKGLQTYSMMLVWGEYVYGFFGVNSILELTKYALAGLIKNKTGKFLDRDVSALTGAALRKFEYDETAHRVWRRRIYGWMEETFPIAPRFLQAFDNVLSQK